MLKKGSQEPRQGLACKINHPIYSGFKKHIPNRQMTSFITACMQQFTKFSRSAGAPEEDYEKLGILSRFIKQLKEIEYDE